VSVVAPPQPPPSQEDLETLIREARARQRRRRLTAAFAVGLAAAAAMGVYGGLAGSSSTSTRSRQRGPAALSSLPHCRSDQLRLTAPRMWGAAAGSLIEGFTLTNASRRTCAVSGWPDVRRLGRSGRPIPVTLERWVYEQHGPAPFRVVRLRPGRAASFPVFGEDWNHAVDRACPNARTVRVEPPGGRGWLSVALKIPACAGWNVGPLVPGRQAPWPTFALSEFYAEHGRTYSGRQGGASWKLTAQDSGDGRYCFTVFTNGGRRGSRCGRFDGPGVAGKLGWIARSRDGRPSFVAGAVISKAQVVAVRLSRGDPHYVQTMTPTRHLAPGISFFFTTVPRGAKLVSIVGSTHDGRRVVAWHRP
jgi:uncharacterized protein DUF4232